MSLYKIKQSTKFIKKKKSYLVKQKKKKKSKKQQQVARGHFVIRPSYFPYQVLFNSKRKLFNEPREKYLGLPIIFLSSHLN